MQIIYRHPAPIQHMLFIGFLNQQFLGFVPCLCSHVLLCDADTFRPTRPTAIAMQIKCKVATNSTTIPIRSIAIVFRPNTCCRRGFHLHTVCSLPYLLWRKRTATTTATVVGALFGAFACGSVCVCVTARSSACAFVRTECGQACVRTPPPPTATSCCAYTQAARVQ